MPTKIRIKVGEVEVDYEGPESFLNQKLHELIKQLVQLSEQVKPSASGRKGKSKKQDDTESVGTIAKFLDQKKAKDNQVRRFLATAEWLHLKGKKDLQTSDVTKALRENRQGRLSNASDSLNKNITKGLCEKDGSDFFVTDDGRKDLG